MPEPASDEARTFAVEVWPLARILAEIRCGSQDWTWEEEWADLDTRHAETGYLDQLEQQIRANGITMPVLIGTDGRLWDGHHRLRIAVRLGIDYVPVEVPTACPQSAAGCRHPAPTCQHGCRAAADELTRLGQDMEAPMPEPTPAEPHVCKPGATVYYCPTAGETESNCHGGFDVCCGRTDLHQKLLRCNHAHLRHEHPAHSWEPQPDMTPVHCEGYGAPVPPPADVRDQIAETLAGHAGSKAFLTDEPGWDHARAAWHAHADAVLRVPVIAEALNAAAAVARARVDRDEWETTAYRHAKLWRDEQDTSRRLLEQRQEMAAERYAWQERGDKAESELASLKRAHVALAEQAGKDQAALAETRNALAMQQGVSADLRVESKARGDKLERVRKIHRSERDDLGGVECGECRTPYPCPTIAALDPQEQPHA